MTFKLPLLPYAYDALEPYMSQKTLEFHHDRHHSAYVSTLNTLIKGTEFEERSLEEIIFKTYGDTNRAKIFSSASQVWNHDFFWNCMKPDGGGKPSKVLMERMVESFGTFEQFVSQFQSIGTAQLGSGYIWLVLDTNKLKVVTTSNAMSPLVNQQIPLFTCDVWEHAYYLDFQDRRSDYLQAFLKYLVSWEFVAQQLQKQQLAFV